MEKTNKDTATENEEKHPAVAKPELKPKVKKAATAYHDSNPFTSSTTGIKQLFELNFGSLVGVSLFNILLVVILAIAAALMIVAALVALFPQGISGLTSAEDNATLQTMGSSLYNPATWIIGGLVVAVVLAFMQAMQIKVASASAASRRVGFGTVFKASAKALLPLLALTAIMFAAIAIALLLNVLLAMALGPIVVILSILTVVASMYVAVRLAFASFAIIEEHLSPIAALKDSWALTKGHFAEVVGSIMAMMIVLIGAGTILNVLGNIFEHTPLALVVEALALVTNLLISIVALTCLAVRYHQLRLIRQGALLSRRTHYLNYVAILGVVVGFMILSMLSARGNNNPNDFFQQLQNDMQDAQSQQEQDHVPQQTPEDRSRSSPLYNYQ